MHRKVFSLGFGEGEQWSWRRPVSFAFDRINQPLSFFCFFIVGNICRIDIGLSDRPDCLREEVGGLVFFSIRFKLWLLMDFEIAIPVYWRPKITRLEQYQKEFDQGKWESVEAGHLEYDNGE